MSTRPRATLTVRSRHGTIGANDQLLSAAQYAPIIIAYRNGSPVRISDVATVVDSAENVRQAAWVNTTPAVIVNIQRQPGTNIIGVVNSIEALLPQLKASLPLPVQVSVVSDRTTTIRASVRDVEFELLLTIGLVVAVIFVFLRNLPATIIPGIAVPLSIVGTFGVMYLLGYSLDNLSLMALTISTGFVVDDAIVMIENIDRYIEMGCKPLEAALKGSARNRVHHRVTDRLTDRGSDPAAVHGRHCGPPLPRICHHPCRNDCDVRDRLFDVHTDDERIASEAKPAESRGWFYQKSEAIFQKTIEKYGDLLKVALRHQMATMLIAGLTLATTVFLFIIIPKGFFPVQDTGVILGISAAPESVSFSTMAQRQQELAKVILQDPAVENLSSFIGVDPTNNTPNWVASRSRLNPRGPRCRRIGHHPTPSAKAGSS